MLDLYSGPEKYRIYSILNGRNIIFDYCMFECPVLYNFHSFHLLQTLDSVTGNCIDKLLKVFICGSPCSLVNTFSL